MSELERQHNLCHFCSRVISYHVNQEKYLKVYNQYGPLWNLLDKETSEKVRKGNYARIFDEARLKVRAWEDLHVARP